MCGILASCTCRQITRHTVDSHASELNGVAGVDRRQTQDSEDSQTATKAEIESLPKNLQDGINDIQHRGPDGSGVWISKNGQVGLAHCRLSINDLSTNGSQPLHSDDGEIHAVVNGEIYDHDRLRRECGDKYGYRFSSDSDSELVIALYKIYGCPGLFQYLRGEFAFVLYDDREGFKRTIAGRDRFGIKPLLWTTVSEQVLFASEAKAFTAMGWVPEWDVRGISDCGWLVDDRTIFKGVKKLMPGHWMEVTEKHGVQIKKYWDAEYPDKVLTLTGKTEPDIRSVDDMVLGVRERLVESVRLRLQADVPVGIYLSGGIDSSTIAGIAADLVKKQNVPIGNEESRRISCFSIRFGEESEYDETAIADRTAKWLGVECFKLNLDEQALSDNFAEAAYHCEHHHFDLNAVAKFCLSEFTRQHGVKAVLTGEGSDEHFCGYPSFATEFLREPDLTMLKSAPSEDVEFREALCKTAHAETRATWRPQASQSEMAATMAVDNNSTMPDSLLAWQPPKHVYQEWIREEYGDEWDSRKTLMASHSKDVLDKLSSKWHPSNSAMYLWNKSILINVILACLGDRAEMAHSIEGRTPFLDHQLAEYVNALPPSIKIMYAPPEINGIASRPAGSALQHLTEKWILREAARPYITDELYNRKKVTFWAPTNWPKGGPLHKMFSGLLTREAVENLGFVDYEVIERALDAAFGDNTDAASFRIVCYTAGWVTIARKFGVRKATMMEFD